MTTIRSILLAEDSPADAEMAIDVLRGANLTNPIVHVQDGAEALDYLFARDKYAGRDGGDPATLRVLVIDDSADDVELMRFALEDGGLAVECLRVFTEVALREALAGFAASVVLSDLNIPGFSGQRALEVVREAAPGLPFVFVTGWLGETSTLESADALVQKDQLERLPALLGRLLA
ncbi:response regulator [Aerolutibacter ruishenii]|uniref:CheY-like chemotaxis protein n=1 Tax=Aerolutibacter ruishenii TaxID=686800 RepID=A0A562LGX9_9GAMM|nr:response regulator [Lysobacter ruishenii]TWI06863.1 CheY-like chemotaxis protein [Lysobacter ruishenii]